MLRSTRKLLVGTAIVAAAAMFALSSAQADTLKLRLSVESTPGAATQHMLASFRDFLKGELGDKVEIEFFDSGTLGDEIVHMEQVQTGQLDVIPIGSDAARMDPKWFVFDIPFLFKDRVAVSKVFDGDIGRQLDASFQNTVGLKVLGFGEIGFHHISNNVRPVRVPADLKGLKLRTAGSPGRVMAFEMLGANPITMNIGEVYLAMQQGVVDGQENPFGNINKWKWYEVQKYISLSRHVYTPITFVMNLNKYNSLTPEQRTAVDRAAIRAEGASRQYGTDNDANLLSQIKTASKGKVAFNDIDSAAFQAAAAPIAKEISKFVGDEEFVNAVLKAIQ
jgi:tripartite ATP-independent transporter DctP family solute receptor